MLLNDFLAFVRDQQVWKSQIRACLHKRKNGTRIIKGVAIQWMLYYRHSYQEIKIHVDKCGFALNQNSSFIIVNTVAYTGVEPVALLSLLCFN